MLCLDAAAALCVLALLLLLAADTAVADGQDKRAIGEPLAKMIAEYYSENRTGSWRCSDRVSRRNGASTFEFKEPSLPMVLCYASNAAVLKPKKTVKGRESMKRVFSDDDLYVVLRGAGKPRRGTYACKVCERRWVANDVTSEAQQVVRQCRYGSKLRGVPKGGHPLSSKGGVRYTRLDGMRCYLPQRRGCDRGYAWCDGLCCRPEALFYYASLQQDVGVGGQLLADNEERADAEERRLLQAVRERETTPRDGGVRRHPAARKKARPKGKTLAEFLQTSTAEERRRFFSS